MKSLPGVRVTPVVSATTPSARGFPRRCVLSHERFVDLKRAPTSHLYTGGCVLGLTFVSALPRPAIVTAPQLHTMVMLPPSLLPHLPRGYTLTFCFKIFHLLTKIGYRGPALSARRPSSPLKTLFSLNNCSS